MKKTFYILFISLCVIYSMPLVITVTNSFMSQWEIGIHYTGTKNHYMEMRLIPDMISLSQYKQILIQTPSYMNSFWNSVIITLSVVAGHLAISAMGAYAFHTLKFKGKEIIFFTYIIVMLLPLQVTLMPNYIIADKLNITDSYLAIILPGIFNPFGVFLIRQYIAAIPYAYNESAEIDGASSFTIFTKIILPNIKPGLAAVAILTFIDYWNLIDQGVIFIKSVQRQPLSLFIAGINSEQMGVAFAASSFYMFPVLVIIFYCQDYLKEGIQLSGLKG